MSSDYFSPESLDQALEYISDGRPWIMAGGTDLMIRVRESKIRGGPKPDGFLDLTRLPETNRLDVLGERPYIGAAVTFHRLETDPDAVKLYPSLARAAGTVGSVQIRRLATIGGNVANASPAADGTTVMTLFGARAEIASKRGIRFSPVEELILGPNRTTLAKDEIILGFELDRPPASSGQCFSKVGRRKAVTIARLNAAACLTRDLSAPRIVLGACFPSPRRLKAVEALVAGGEAGPELWEAAGRLAADEFVGVCGWRSSAPYKVPAITRVLAGTLAQAHDRAGEVK